jgi:hypothetical protein
VNTTITVNGHGGSRFLAFLAASGSVSRLPPPLATLVRASDSVSIVVDLDLAEEVADFVDRVISDGTYEHTADEPPLLFSPNVGDGVAIVRDVLVEMQGRSRRGPRTWKYIKRGTRGRVIAHQGETDRVLLEPSHEIAFVRPRCMSRFWR